MNMQQLDEAINNVVNYYGHLFNEQARLSRISGQIELLRTQQLVRRYIKPPPALVLDVGGAAGRYACWLAQAGYEVHLIDPVPLHVQQAQEASAAQPEAPIARCAVGDARQLACDDELADAVLLMGPLYHLVEAQDRRQALAEAYRVLKSGGCLFAAGISRFASTLDGLASGYALDPTFQQIMLRDLKDGQHRNPTQNPAYFTTAFFHHPQELADEVTAVGFRLTALLAVEGVSCLAKDLREWWSREDRRELLLDLVGRLEQEPSLIGVSPHLMCVAEKP
jgi:ubiquinone/menaquinone biosynthesis C-methylase UbiE